MVVGVYIRSISSVFHRDADRLMAARQKGEKRKQRWVGATDAEWTEICEGAQAAGLSNSDYVIRCCLDGKARAKPTDVGLPPPVLHRAVKAALILEELQKLRLVNDGETGEALWQRAVGEVDAWVEGEGGLG